ncbi:MAG: hypothetical protein HUK02_02565 [Bacteroidaceae bacterium]|nr:hypothetical protein [Bacteroidaceae bacterium]
MSKIVKQIISESNFKCLFNLSSRENTDEFAQILCTAAFVGIFLAFLQYV